MKTRIIRTLAAVAVGAVVAGTSVGAEAQEVRWRLQSAWPDTLVQYGTGGKRLVDTIERLSGGDMELRFHAPNALVPTLQIFEAVSKGSVDAGWGASAFWAGQIKAAPFFSAVPFGPNPTELLSWIYYGGGKEVYEEMYAKRGVKGIFCGVTAPEASGWFSEEITSLDQLQGLKMRAAGFAAAVLEKYGVSAQLTAPGDLYTALERGTIDAAELSMPAVDLNLKLYEVADHYYFPGWHQPSTLLELIVNMETWEGLTDQQQAIVEAACAHNIVQMQAEGDALQQPALDEMVEKGVQIHTWPDDVLDQLRETWQEVAAELASEDPEFKAAWDSYTSYRDSIAQWKRLGYVD